MVDFSQGVQVRLEWSCFRAFSTAKGSEFSSIFDIYPQYQIFFNT